VAVGDELGYNRQVTQTPQDQEGLKRFLDNLYYRMQQEPLPAADELPNRMTFPAHMGSKTQVVQEPQNVRSIFAAFDPTKMDSKDLLASFLAAVGVGLGAHQQE